MTNAGRIRPEDWPDMSTQEDSAMSVFSALGITPGRKVRYAIVALGDIAQEGMLPGVEHTGNSELTALVTGDPEKARVVGDRYGVAEADRYGYDRYEEMLRSGKVDAVYIAAPNWRHAEFAVPALKAGIHVLLEKGIEVTTAKAEEILAAEKTSRAKLMMAYRLHSEPATLDLIEKVRAGTLGDVILFTSVFTQMLDPANHRAHSGDDAGPVLDMGLYPLNAARHVFEAEPIEVACAIGTRHPGAGLGDFDDTVAVTLRFPGERFAQLVLSYATNAMDAFTVVGTKGTVVMDPAYLYGKPLEQAVTIGEKKSRESFKNTDHFGGEMRYFSDCILNDKAPESDGEEGYADLRVLLAILQALRSKRPVTLEPFTRRKRIDPDAQEETLKARTSPELVNASNAGKGKSQIPMN